MTRQQPRLTVDLIIVVPDGRLVLVKRKHPPPGWALPGGFVDWGETLEEAAVREALEETGLAVTLRGQMHTYSDPSRDPRGHTVSTVFVAEAAGVPTAGDDAGEADLFQPTRLPPDIAFDHRAILKDFLEGRYPVG